MFDLNLQRVATAVGSLLFTAVFVGAAVGPARSIETSPVSYAQIAAPVAVQANV